MTHVTLCIFVVISVKDKRYIDIQEASYALRKNQAELLC